MDSISTLLSRIERDPWRSKNPFSAETVTACEVLLNPFARDDERKEAIRGWLAKYQPCVFGQVAARGDRLFISIIDEALIQAGDAAIREKLRQDKRTWKQWSMEGKGMHGFLVVVVSSRLHYGAPNRAMKEFASRVRDLISEDCAKDPVGNDMSYECVYLKNPATGQYHRFKVIMDFFASAGDGRWWHDHRFPGGIAFTFNSLGHMARTREWYENNSRPIEWAARMAMTTIGNAFAVGEHGKATWLVERGSNAEKKMKCPFAKPDAVPEALKGKDWTGYRGFHHTDHSVRDEFFDGRETPDRSRGAYMLDFSYIGGEGEGENAELMNGVVVGSDVVEKDIGSPEEWRFDKPAAKAGRRPQDEEAKILAALKQCREWLDSKIPNV